MMSYDSDAAMTASTVRTGRSSNSYSSDRAPIAHRLADHDHGTSALHLVHCEINAVTSAMRKHARNAASSSFLGTASGAGTSGASGPVPSGSSAASLLKNAVVAAAAALTPPATQTATSASSAANGAQGHHHQSRPSQGRLEQIAGRDEIADSAVRGETVTHAAPKQRYVYADGRRDDDLASLLNGFTILRAQLRDCSKLDSFSLPFLVLPFLRVILSPRTTGPVTSIALQALHRLVIYKIVHLPARGYTAQEIWASRPDQRDGPTYIHPSSAHLAITEIAHAVSHCRFEASDAAADELVLLRILAVMRELICGDGTIAQPFLEQRADFSPVRRRGSLRSPLALADWLGDESICEMMETGLSMCCQSRLSDLLRRTSEQSMTTMVRAIFARLETFPLASDEAFSSDPNARDREPEHATLAADPIGDDALDADKEKRLRRMTMPDPASLNFPAAGIDEKAMDDLKAVGEHEDAQRQRQPSENSPSAAADPAQLSEIREEGSSDRAEADTSASVQRNDDAPSPLPSQAEQIRVEVRPFGLPAIKEVLRVIVSLLDPHNVQHTDTMRLLGLNLLSSIFEVAGQSIGEFPTLRAMVQDSACKYLFGLVKSDNSQLQAASLRTVSTLFETMRPHLKLQHELFLSYFLDRSAPTFPMSAEPWKDEASNLLAVRRAALMDQHTKGSGMSSPSIPQAPPPPPMPKSSDRSPVHGEAREHILETLSLLLGTYTPRHDGVDPLVELWINYDCDVECENMFEKFIIFLCRAVYASNPLHPQIQESTQLFAIDALLNFVGNMAARQENASLSGFAETDWPEHLPQPDVLTGQKRTKAALLLGAEKFNVKPKDGLAYFEGQGFIESSEKTAASRQFSIARFLKDCPRLDKRVLGDFLSRPDNEEILKAFLGLFDFSDTPIAEAMREMLEAFRLPGESQQIARITETFASIYFASQPPNIKSEDAVYVLSYSVIMLNTDLHNPQNKRRMTVDDYRKNLRGVNDGTDFDAEFLGSIYDSIRRREIVMPEEHKGQLGFEYAWKELLRRSRRAGGLLCTPTTQFDRDIFEASWRPIVASIAHAFSTYRDEHIIERAISGFRQCALLAGHFGMHEIFDFMIRALAGATGLLDANGAGAVTNNAVVDVENQKVTVSPLSVQFGRNFKGQLAAVVLFTIANGNGDAVRQGWTPIFEIFKNLFINSLLAPSIGLMFEFGSEADLKPIPIKAKRAPGPPPQDPRSQSSTGLFSTISSYLLSPYSSEREATKPDVAINEDAVESSLCTADCVASCRIDDLYAELMMLSPGSRQAAIESLIALANRYTVEKLTRLQTDGSSSVMQDPSSGRSTPVQGVGSPMLKMSTIQYDAGAAFALELATNLACSEDENEASVNWSVLSAHISSVLSAPDQYHPLQVERAIVALFRLIKHTAWSDDLRDQIFMELDRVHGLPAEYRLQVAAQVTAGLYEVIASTSNFAKSRTEWSLICSLLATYGSLRSASAARFSMRAAQAIAQTRAEGQCLVKPENFGPLVALLRDFAISAEAMTRQEMTSPRTEGAQRKTLTEKRAIEEFREACQERGPAAVYLLTQLRVYIPEIVYASQVSTVGTTWQQYWLPLMSAISRQYASAHRATRQAALVSLPKVMLAPELLQHDLTAQSPREDNAMLQSLFQDVLFPTLHELLKPEVFQLDPGNESGSMQETRMRACNLLCKVFLHYMGRMAQPSDDEATTANHVEERFLHLWLTVLDFFDRFMHSAQRDALTEATSENLKNVLLVMNAAGLLLPPSAVASGSVEEQEPASTEDLRTPGQRQLFDQTFKRIGRFMPDLRKEIFPEPGM